jgi:hypothetical protein
MEKLIVLNPVVSFDMNNRSLTSDSVCGFYMFLRINSNCYPKQLQLCVETVAK